MQRANGVKRGGVSLPRQDLIGVGRGEMCSCAFHENSGAKNFDGLEKPPRREGRGGKFLRWGGANEGIRVPMVAAGSS